MNPSTPGFAHIANLGSCCLGHPGWGAWSYSLSNREDGKEVSRRDMAGAMPGTTASRMELEGAVELLRHLATSDQDSLLIITASRELHNVGSQLQSRRRTRLDTKEHPDLWMEIADHMTGRPVQFQAEGRVLLTPRTEAANKLAREAVEAARAMAEIA